MTKPPARLVLVGHPVSHSLSPAFQNAALRSAGIPLVYECLDVAPTALDACLDALIMQRAAGNVTIPHKDAVAARCTQRSALAERVGAVNTFWVDDAGLAGDNTDVGGFDALAARVLGETPSDARVSVLGAGGAAAAVLAAVERWPRCRVVLCNRGADRRDRLAARFPIVCRTTDDPAAAARDCTVVVNATSIGLHDDAHPVDVGALPRGCAVIDIVYRRGETSWVRAARAAGHTAADGLTMLVEQGALSFERWFGRPAPRAVMRRAVGAS